MGLFQLATLAATLVGILAGGRLWDVYRQNAFVLDAMLSALDLLVYAVGIHEPAPDIANRRSSASALRPGVAALGKTFGRYREPFTSPAVLRFGPAFLAINMILDVWLNHVIGQVMAADNRFPDQGICGILAKNRNAGTGISIYATGLLAIFVAGVIVWSVIVGRVSRTKLMLFDGADLFELCLLLFAMNHGSLADPYSIVVTTMAAVALYLLSGIIPAALTFLADQTEERNEDRGAVMSLYAIFFGLGGFLGTLLCGPFADWGGFDGRLTVTMLLGAAAFVLLFRLHMRERQSST